MFSNEIFENLGLKFERKKKTGAAGLTVYTIRVYLFKNYYHFPASIEGQSLEAAILRPRRITESNPHNDDEPS